MDTVFRQHVSGDQTACPEQPVRACVEPVPLVGVALAVEPDRVVEAGALESVAVGADPLEVGMRRAGRPRRGGVGHERQRAGMVDRVVADVCAQPDPVPESAVGQVDRPALDQLAPRRVLQARVVGARHVVGDRGELLVGLVLVDLERHGQVEDRPGGLAGHHLTGAERPAVAQPFHLVADRFVRGAGTDEVRVQRVCRPVGLDGGRCRPRGLGDDLTAEQASAPRIAGGDRHERVRPMRFEPQQVTELDVDDVGDGHPSSLAAFADRRQGRQELVCSTNTRIGRPVIRWRYLA